MNKEKRNIATKLETESKYLTNILDKDDVKDFVKDKLTITPVSETQIKKDMRDKTLQRYEQISKGSNPIIDN